MTAIRPTTAAHATTHKLGGTDAVKLNELALPTAAVDVNSQKITGLATPTLATDAATKGYADALAQGLDVKVSVRVGTTVNITLSGTQTIDGVAVIANDRVLVKNQTTGANNGIYLVAAGAWTRSTDADVSAEVNTGMFTFLESGTTQGDTGWVLVTDNPIALGTTALSFTQFSGGGGGADSDATVTFTDITTNNSSTAKHGFLPKLNNDDSTFMNGKGGWSRVYSPREWWVDQGVSAATGRSPTSPFNSFAAAIAAASDGDQIYVVGPILQENLVISKRVRVLGVGDQPTIYPPNGQTSVDDKTVHVTVPEVVMENFTIHGDATWKGIHLALDRATSFRGSHLHIHGNGGGYGAAYPTSPGAGTGLGGICVLQHACELVYLEQCWFQNSSIALVSGQEATGTVVNKCQFSGSGQDIVMGLLTGPDNTTPLQPGPYAYGGGVGGGWTFKGCKSTSPTGGLQPIIDLIGDGTINYAGANNGYNVFERCEFAEGIANIIRIGSFRNLFNGFACAPTSVLHVEGQKNRFEQLSVGYWKFYVDGDHNVFDGVEHFGTIRGAGSDNTFRNVRSIVSFSSADVDSVVLTGSRNKFEDCVFAAFSPTAADAPKLTNLGTGAMVKNANGIKALTYATTMTADVFDASIFKITVTNSTGFTIANPIYRETALTIYNIMTTEPITFDILNSSGGAMGTITWGNKFLLAGGAFTNPANTKRSTISFYYDVVTDKWVELTRGVAI